MKTSTKKLLVVMGVTTLLLTVSGPIASFVQYNENTADSAYASALLAQADEDDGEECDPSADDCGSIDDEEIVDTDSATTAETDTAATDTAAADKAAADKAAADKAAADKAAADKKAAEDKAAANKAAAQEAARRATEQRVAQEEAAKKKANEEAAKKAAEQQPAAEAAAAEQNPTATETPVAPVITPEQLAAATNEISAVLEDTLAQTQYQEKADEKAALAAANQLGISVSPNQVSQVQAALAQTNVNSLASQVAVDFEKEVTATAAADIAAQLPAELKGEERKAAINKIVVKAKRKVTDKVIDQVAEKKYGIKIVDIDKKVKSEVGAKILLGVDPTAQDKGGDFSLLEQVLFNVDDKDLQDLTAFFSDDLLASAVGGLKKKSFMGVMPNSKLSTDGFTVPVACPKNEMITLTAKNTKGAVFTLGTKKCSENSKAVFSSDQPLKPGYYAFQVKPAKTQALLPGDLLASTVGQPETGGTSDPVLVKIVPSTDIPQPIVKAIENVDVAGLRNIQVTAGTDGKIHVSGTADISSIVVGTFESAVFTSAMLADAEGGMFEVVSSKPLPMGDHEITIYSTRPDERSQSSPVKLKFSLIQTANAASNEVVVDTGKRGAAETKGKFPVIPVAAGAGVVVAVVIGVLLTRKKKVQ